MPTCSAWTLIRLPAYCMICLLHALRGPKENMESHMHRMTGLDLGGLAAKMSQDQSSCACDFPCFLLAP